MQNMYIKHRAALEMSSRLDSVSLTSSQSQRYRVLENCCSELSPGGVHHRHKSVTDATGTGNYSVVQREAWPWPPYAP